MANFDEILTIETKAIKLSESNTSYLKKKLDSLDHFYKYFSSINILIEEDKFEHNPIKIVVTLTPHKGNSMRIEEAGYDLYSLIDLTHDKLRQLLEKYKEKISDDGKSIKSVFNDPKDEPQRDSQPIQSSDYDPEIRYVYYSDNRPIKPSEAIQQMELLGHTSFLFKNYDSGKYAMLLKKEEGRYKIVEPESI